MKVCTKLLYISDDSESIAQTWTRFIIWLEPKRSINRIASRCAVAEKLLELGQQIVRLRTRGRKHFRLCNGFARHGFKFFLARYDERNVERRAGEPCNVRLRTSPDCFFGMRHRRSDCGIELTWISRW